MRDARKLGGLIVILTFAAVTAVPALAFLYPLSSTAIRDAYFIGSRNDEQTRDFLTPYEHDLPAPQTGPYVHDIGIDTPFVDVVRGTEGDPNMHAPDAVEAFQNKPLEVIVHVSIWTTNTYSPGPQVTPELYQWVPDFWDDFKVQLIQRDKVIGPKRVRGGPLFLYIGETPSVVGARLELSYDPATIESAPATVEVLTPDGQKVGATFDLGKLR
jgi:hypothetical protein